MTDSASQVSVRNNQQTETYEAVIRDSVVGRAVYDVEGQRVVFLHTVVEPELRGQGIASALIRGSLDDVRARGLRITVFCPAVAEFIERHPEYADLLDPEHPGARRPA